MAADSLRDPEEQAFSEAILKWIDDVVGREEIRRRLESVTMEQSKLSEREAFDTTLPPQGRRRFDWYVYTLARYKDSLFGYDINSGARIIPSMLALGRDIEEIKVITGADERMLAASKGKQDIESVVFELLVAAKYAKEGGKVEFLEPAISKKTPDLRAVTMGGELFVECKRKQKSSGYSEQERRHWFRLSRPIFDFLRYSRLPIVLDVMIHRPLEELGDDYFEKALVPKLAIAIPGVILDDEDLRVSLRNVEMNRIRDHFKHNSVRANSTFLNHLLYGDFDLSRGVTDLLEVDFISIDGSPYIDNLTYAAGVIWSCDAPAAIRAKARDLRADLADAVDQLPRNAVCAVHWAVEIYDGEAVEDERLERIMKTIARFSTDRDVRWIYCHLLGFTVPHDMNWDFTETVHTIGRFDGRKSARSADKDPFLLKSPLVFAP